MSTSSLLQTITAPDNNFSTLPLYPNMEPTYDMFPARQARTPSTSLLPAAPIRRATSVADSLFANSSPSPSRPSHQASAYPDYADYAFETPISYSSPAIMQSTGYRYAPLNPYPAATSSAFPFPPFPDVSYPTNFAFPQQFQAPATSPNAGDPMNLPFDMDLNAYEMEREDEYVNWLPLSR